MFGPVGSRVGTSIGSGIDKIVGSGDYVVSSSVKSNSLAGTTPPMFGSATGTTVIRHREFVSDIFSSTNFLVRSYPIAPGLTNLFPWLSQIAVNYEQYRIRGLVFDLKSTSASALNSTNTALGVMGIATQYDADEPDFQSKQEAENYIGCQSTNPSNSILHFVECARGQNVLDHLYTRSGQLGADQDIKFYDLGKLQIFTQGMQAAGVNIAELWVSYEVEFSKPKLPAGGLTQLTPCDVFEFNTAGSNTWAGAGGVTRTPTYGNIGSYINNNTIFFPSTMPAGRYIINIDGVLTSGTGIGSAAATTVSVSGNITLANVFATVSGFRSGSVNFPLPATANPNVLAFNVAFDLGVQSTGTISTLTLNSPNFPGTGVNWWNLVTFLQPIANYNITVARNKITSARLANVFQGYGIDMDMLRRAVTWYRDQDNSEEQKQMPKLEIIGKQKGTRSVKGSPSKEMVFKKAADPETQTSVIEDEDG